MASAAMLNTRDGSDLTRGMREVPQLITRYINQLIYGCGNVDCKEVLCRTGIRNTSNGKPVRVHTPRSARTVAISMCAGPNPRSHLCPHVEEGSWNKTGLVQSAERPGDPSALDQQLSDTRSFKLLQNPATFCIHDKELQAQHDKVSRLLEAAQRHPSIQTKGFLSNAELVDGLVPCAEWLLAKLPLHRPVQFMPVNDLISKGFAYPTKNGTIPAGDDFNERLTILDTIHHKPYLRLLGRIVQVVAARQAVELSEANSEIEKSINLMRRYDDFPDDHLLSEQHKHSLKHYLVLYVSRGNVLQDAFDQLWQRRKNELKRPLRVRLGEIEEHEVGHDLGGVQIEFFNLVCKKAFAVEAQMFITDEQTGISYFRPGSLQPLHMFELLGTLLALAIYNGITLPISLPRAYYRILAGLPSPASARHAIEEINDGWPVLARSLQNVLDDDIPGLEISYPFEANGIHMQTLLPIGHYSKDPVRQRIPLLVTSAIPEVAIKDISEQLPGWNLRRVPFEPKEVTPDNKESYIKGYVLHASYCSATPQWQAFERGFWDSKLIEKRHLRLFSPSQLKTLVEGTSHLDITFLRSVTQYDGYGANDMYIHRFWRIVLSWPEVKQKQLLKFVTAAERIPITGGLTFIIKRYDSENSERLPTSSTCFGTLMLPMYRNERVLEQKLSLALKYGSEGFGTG
ncbi:hypothetical protein PRZ48_000329 [Zasmidium cellare]|uniref:HECT-type E3 ubiquitin transferase n=1 Tax=Zasmidium cellare TaxID=395010 RepID=A0ABR0EYH9_ZASCE|nr:hypothetical protein PRZ48_000329 [Zasmidium cellare]